MSTMSCLICEKAVPDHEEIVKLIERSKIWRDALLNRISKRSQDAVHVVHVHCRKEYTRKRDLDSVKARRAALLSLIHI